MFETRRQKKLGVPLIALDKQKWVIIWEYDFFIVYLYRIFIAREKIFIKIWLKSRSQDGHKPFVCFDSQSYNSQLVFLGPT